METFKYLTKNWGFNFETFIKVTALVAVVSGSLAFVHGMDGRNCNGKFSIFSPKSAWRNAGCIVRQFTSGMNPNFDADPGIEGEGDAPESNTGTNLFQNPGDGQYSDPSPSPQ